MSAPIIATLPVIRPFGQKAGSEFFKIFKDLFKNKGVQAGVGLGSAGVGLSILGQSTKEVTQPFGELSPILIIIVVVAILALMLRSRK